MITRRKIATFAPLLGFTSIVAACSTTSNGNAVPTLAQIQAYVNVLKTELPLFVQESISTGIIKSADVPKAQTALTGFETIADQVLSPAFNVSTVNQTLMSLGAILTSIASFVPAAAPWVGLVQLTVMLISAFIAVQPIAVVPPVPTPVVLGSMHKDTLHFHKK